MVPEIAVERIGEIDRRRCRGQIDNVAFRSEDEHAMREKILFEPRDEFFRTGDVRMRFSQLGEPGRNLRHSLGLALFPSYLHKRGDKRAYTGERERREPAFLDLLIQFLNPFS